MAVWQFQFTLAPEAGIRRVHGELVSMLPEYAARDPDAPLDEDAESESYWGQAGPPPSMYVWVEKLLPERRSWSSDARMFGDEDGDSVEVWNDAVFCSFDMRRIDPSLLASMLEMAQDTGCMIVLKDDGRVVAPVRANVLDEANRSRAAAFVKDPVAYLRQLR